MEYRKTGIVKTRELVFNNQMFIYNILLDINGGNVFETNLDFEKYLKDTDERKVQELY